MPVPLLRASSLMRPNNLPKTLKLVSSASILKLHSCNFFVVVLDHHHIVLDKWIILECDSVELIQSNPSRLKNKKKHFFAFLGDSYTCFLLNNFKNIFC